MIDAVIFDNDGLPRPFAKAPRLIVYRRELYDYAECINLLNVVTDRFPELDRQRPPLHPDEPGPKPAAQKGGEQLLLLEVEDQDVVGADRGERVPHPAQEERPAHAERVGVSPGQLRPKMQRHGPYSGALCELRLVGQQHRLVPAGHERVKHRHGGELRTALGARRQNRHDPHRVESVMRPRLTRQRTEPTLARCAP